MKYILFLFTILLSFSALAQEKEDSIYFPQEQLIHEKCESADDTNSCLDRVLYNITKPILDKSVLSRKIIPDTLKIGLRFAVDGNGKVIQDYAWSSFNDSIMRKTLKDTLDYKLENLPRFKIQNKKPEEYQPTHTFTYHFTQNEATHQLQEIAIDSLLTYKGGDIFQAPIFKGCERKTDKQNRRCFQEKIQQHISKNFRYPKKAYKKGIQGKVSVMFIIDKEGNVKNIRTKGPAPILEEEAKRIIRLLPKPSPALKNGKGVKIPFSIPITFRLQ